MDVAYFAPLVTLPDIITGPGEYLTRNGDVVSVFTVSGKHDFGCVGVHCDGIYDRWHKSGRLFATREAAHDIVAIHTA